MPHATQMLKHPPSPFPSTNVLSDEDCLANRLLKFFFKCNPKKGDSLSELQNFKEFNSLGLDGYKSQGVFMLIKDSEDVYSDGSLCSIHNLSES